MQAQIKEIEIYTILHPELKPQDASIEWIRKYAKEFADKWRNKCQSMDI